MLKSIKNLIKEYETHKLTRDQLTRKLYDRFNEAYHRGLSAEQEIKRHNYESLCEPCGRRLFPILDEGRLNGITVMKGLCPRCKCHATLVPIRDFAYAAGYPGVLWD